MTESQDPPIEDSNQGLGPQEFQQYTKNWTRDIAWLLCDDHNLPITIPGYDAFSSPVSDTNSIDIIRTWLTQLDQLTTSPISFHPRLGKYFEHLIAYFLSNNPIAPTPIVEQNKVVYGTQNGVRETRGELDLIVEDNRQLVHIEVAVKFYLQTTINGDQFLGPNSKDALATKLQRLQSHQLPLSKTLQLNNFNKSVYWLKGCLFKPWDKKSRSQDQWMRFENLKSFVEENEEIYTVLNKSRWLGGQWNSPTQPTNEILNLVHNALETGSNGVMLMATSSGDNIDLPARVMIVPNHWPEPRSNPK